MVNSERNLTLLQPAVPPPGEALPDWQLICRVAAQMGFADAFRVRVRRGGLRGDQAVLESRRPATTCAASATTGCGRRRCSGRARPDERPTTATRSDTSTTGSARSCSSTTDGPCRGWRSRPRRGRAVFYARPHLPPEEMPDDDYPFLLNTGRLQHQWHTMTKTGKVAKLNKLNPGPFVEIHPEDAARLEIADGDPVEIAVAPWPRRAARRGHRPGAAGQLLRAVPLERRLRRIPDRSTRSPTTRSTRLAATGVQGVRGAPAARRNRYRADELASSPRAALEDDEKLYLAGFFTGLAEGAPGVTGAAGCLRPCATVVRLWLDGLLAGRYSRLAAGVPQAAGQGRAAGAVGVTDRQRRGVRGAVGRRLGGCAGGRTWTRRCPRPGAAGATC